MADFNQAGGLPTGYGELLSAARQQLVKRPDGSYAVVPQFGGATSVDEIYKGILPPNGAGTALKARTVPTYRVDGNGTPIIAKAPGFAPPTVSMASTQAEQRSGARPAITQGSQPAGTTQMAASRPSNIPEVRTDFQMLDGGRMQTASAAPPPIPRARPMFKTFIDSMGRYAPPPEPFDPLASGKSQDQQSSGTGLAFVPEEQWPALDAIDTLMGSGQSSAPRMSPFGYGPPPVPTAPISTAPPRKAAPTTYQIQRGDTLTSLAKQFGTTVKQLANANNIANPNKIRAGSTLNLSFMAPPIPRMPPSAVRPPPQARADRFAGVLDEFGMIR